MGAMGAVISMVGGVVQGIAGMQAHEAEAQAHEYNAAVALRNKEVIRDQGAAAATDQSRANLRQEMAMRGMIAHLGLSMTGTVTDVALDNIKTNQLAVQRINYRTQIAMIEQDDKYNTEKMGAAAEKAAAPLSLVGGILSGLSSGISSLPSG
jgi:phage protein D